MGHHHHYDQEKAHLSQTIVQKSPGSASMDAPGEPMVVDSAAGTDLPLLGHVSVQQFKQLEGECLSLRENNQKMKQQLIDSQRRERLMMRRLAAKEQELLDYVNQVAELKAVQTPGQAALKAALLDPAVNLLFQKLKQELQATQARLEETQNELAAWKFTPDSNTGKRLMAKCRLLHQENEELGKLTSNGRLAKLESELAMQKGVSEDLKKSHCDLDEVLLELEEDVEGMQNTILLMQRELKVARQEEASSRVNGAAPLGQPSKTEAEEETSGSGEPMEVHEGQSPRTRIGDAVIESGDAEEAVERTTPQVQVGDAEGNSVSFGSNNGQAMVTRKRTRSAVAQNNSNSPSDDPAEEPEGNAASVGDVEGKRNRYNNNSSDQLKSAPRTRGQLLIESQEKANEVLTVVEDVQVDEMKRALNNGSKEDNGTAVDPLGNGGSEATEPLRNNDVVA